MGLPFTSDQFFAVFAEYNRAFWFVAVALWFASAGALVAAWRNPVGHSRSLTYFLGTLWGWNAVAYHALLFTRINPAAWLFAALFALKRCSCCGSGLAGASSTSRQPDRCAAWVWAWPCIRSHTHS